MLATLVFAFNGCASPGVPRPPSLHLPATVTDLSAARVGNQVELKWTAPAHTTDGLDVTFPTTVELCRDPVPSTTPGNCTPIRREAGHAGPSTVDDPLPPEWISPATDQQVLSYRVRLLNRAGHSAPPSNQALAPAGPPLLPVQDFQARSTRAGVVLEWRQTAAAPGEVEILRTLQPASAAPPPPRKAAPSSASPGLLGSKNRQSPAEVRLRVGSPPLAPSSSSPRGMLDISPLAGSTYLYSAQRVRVVSLDGKPVEYRSTPTPPIQILRRDTFAPDPPRGLASVPGTFGQPAKPSIDLSWEPGRETGLAGYVVYRLDLSSGPAATSRRLNANPILGPAYSDPDVIPGHRYRYTVTAIDRAGNESSPSVSVEDSNAAK